MQEIEVVGRLCLEKLIERKGPPRNYVPYPKFNANN